MFWEKKSVKLVFAAISDSSTYNCLIPESTPGMCTWPLMFLPSTGCIQLASIYKHIIQESKVNMKMGSGVSFVSAVSVCLHSGRHREPNTLAPLCLWEGLCSCPNPAPWPGSLWYPGAADAAVTSARTMSSLNVNQEFRYVFYSQNWALCCWVFCIIAISCIIIRCFCFDLCCLGHSLLQHQHYLKLSDPNP